MSEQKISGEFIKNLHQADFKSVRSFKFKGNDYDLSNSSRFMEFKKILEVFAKSNYEPKSKYATEQFLKNGGMEGNQWDQRMQLLKVLFPE